MNLIQTAAALKTMEKEVACQTILDWFKFRDVDANAAFMLAGECDIELQLVAVDARD